LHRVWLLLHHLLSTTAVVVLLGLLHVLFLLIVLFHVLSLHILVDHLVLLGREVKLLNCTHLLVKTLNFKLEGVNLRLVVLQLLYHLLELMGSLLEILLVNHKFLCNLWSTLLCQDILQFDVELLLLLYENILLSNLFSLCDQALLKTLDLLNHFISFGVSAFKLSPPVNIEWLFKFVREILCFLLLLKAFFL